MDIKQEYNRWLEKATLDIDLIKELKTYNDAQVEDAFYRNLEFGTAGLRGTIGAGTNRMNVYTVGKATQGLANYIIAHYKPEDRKVAIARDSRLKGDLFQNITAQVMAANGIKVEMYPYISPVPTLSFATRYLNCVVGVMITASHNPSKYNGYKVYGADGCQITTEAADEILGYVEKTDCFEDVKMISLDEGFEKGLISYIPPKVITAFIAEVKKQSFLGDTKIDKNVSIVYSPLNGTGLVPVTRILNEEGYTNITIVKEQELPDGYFPTCSYPNPEIKDTLRLGLEYCRRVDADLMLATDPDADRVGIAVKNAEGEHVLVTGNEVGMLLLDYICSRRIALGTMPERPVFVKTIVSIDMADRIAKDYGVEVRNVLTGFKFIGEQIGLLEKDGEADRYIFGFEESYGYLSGTYVRDKDAVNGATLIAEMFAYYKSQGKSLLDRLNELYAKYGYTLNTQHSFEFEGSSGFTKMQSIMEANRSGVEAFGPKKVVKLNDYSLGIDGLPKSNVLKYYLEDNCSVVIRPSGTEPKLKLYVSVSAPTKEEASALEKQIAEAFEKTL